MVTMEEVKTQGGKAWTPREIRIRLYLDTPEVSTEYRSSHQLLRKLGT